MHLFDLHTTLTTQSSIQDIVQVFERYLHHQHIKHYAFTFYTTHVKTGKKLQFHCASLSLKPWHHYYLEQGYADIDRTLEITHQSTLPIYWDVAQQLMHAKSPREKRIRQESIEFGVDKGLSIPVFGPNKDFASLTLHQFKKENCLSDYQTKQFEWMMAAQLFYAAIKKMLKPQKIEPHFNLTRREQQCLQLTLKSWRVERIAKELNISERTVNFHLQNANKKMGTHNKYQSAHRYAESINNDT